MTHYPGILHDLGCPAFGNANDSDRACTCGVRVERVADLDTQGAATELQALLGVPPGTEGVRLPD